MKKLTRLLLINWHFFRNTVIDFDNINFLTGKNSAGKSTIIDAFQVVLLGETRSSAFNRAASKRSERTLKSYLIGSMGEDRDSGLKSLREGKDFSTYIVAEFYDDVKSEYFCLGAIFDSFSDGGDPLKRFFWLRDRIPQCRFIENGKTMSTKRAAEFFKANYPNRYETRDTAEVYRQIVLDKLNIHDPKFRSMLKKAISFEPINDIEKFITENVCDIEDDIDITAMQDNILYYKRQESDAERFQSRLDRLGEICRQFEEIEKLRKRRLTQQFLIDFGKYNDCAERLEAERKKAEEYNAGIDRLNEEYHRTESEIRKAEDERDRLIEEKNRFWADCDGEILKAEKKRYSEEAEQYGEKTEKFVLEFRTSALKWRAKLEGIDCALSVSGLLDRAEKLSAEDLDGMSSGFFSDIREEFLELRGKLEPKYREIEVKIRSGRAEADEPGDREVLAQVGVIMMPEVFEFCGNVRIRFRGGEVDFSPIKSGSCVSGDSVSEMLGAEIFDTERIIFIENKTNYSDYCLSRRGENELVVYHGGFLSPQRMKFFRLLCSGKNIPAYFWGDIDYGGFKMFLRLKRNVAPGLLPMNMDLRAFEAHKSVGLRRDRDYIKKLKKLKEDNGYGEFYEVIDAIEREGVTVEQESFIERNRL